MKSRVTRPGNRAPSGLRPIYIDDVIEKIDRLEAEYQWWIAVLLECDCCEERCLETMRGARPDDTAKSTHRVASRLSIVWQFVEPSLDREWSAQSVDDSPLDCSQGQRGRDDSRSVEHPTKQQKRVASR